MLEVYGLCVQLLVLLAFVWKCCFCRLWNWQLRSHPYYTMLSNKANSSFCVTEAFLNKCIYESIEIVEGGVKHFSLCKRVDGTYDKTQHQTKDELASNKRKTCFYFLSIFCRTPCRHNDFFFYHHNFVFESFPNKTPPTFRGRRKHNASMDNK